MENIIKKGQLGVRNKSIETNNTWEAMINDQANRNESPEDSEWYLRILLPDVLNFKIISSLDITKRILLLESVHPQ